MARTIIGTVVSDKADKTIVLSTTTRKTHPIYKKQYSKTTKYIAHDEKNEARVGDRVEVINFTGSRGQFYFWFRIDRLKFF